MAENVWLLGLELFAYVLGILVVLWGMRRMPRFLPLRPPAQARLRRLLPFAEAIVVVVGVLWATSHVFDGQPVYAWGALGVLVLVGIGAVWFAVRDVLTGLILKTEGTYQVDQMVEVHGVEGRIERLGFRTLTLTTETGRAIRLPYSRLSHEAVAVQEANDWVRPHTFHVEVPIQLDAEEAHERLRDTILNVAWTSVRQPPRMRVHALTESYRSYEVTIFVLGALHTADIEQRVRQVFAASG